MPDDLQDPDVDPGHFRQDL